MLPCVERSAEDLAGAAIAAAAKPDAAAAAHFDARQTWCKPGAWSRRGAAGRRDAEHAQAGLCVHTTSMADDAGAGMDHSSVLTALLYTCKRVYSIVSLMGTFCTMHQVELCGGTAAVTVRASY